MCGIVGYIARSENDVDLDLLQRMNDALLHRGPDEEGSYRSPAGRERPVACLAMRRLSIIDLSTGKQPIGNEAGTVWIVYNGEVYNHEQLRRELEGLGHRFRTRSDTEAILHAYEEWGAACVHRLRGMFAFAIWDEPRNRLFMARDAVGIKPLYWVQTAARFLFASEIKALLLDSDVPRRMNRAALPHFLSFLYVPPPETLFEGVHQLPPGHHLTWENGELHVEEWWPGPHTIVDPEPPSPAGAQDVWSVLRESVEAHMIADVPLGAFLSGGIDSTLIVALMAELSSRPVKTYSVGFSDAGLYDETPHARKVAARFRTDHREVHVGPDAVRLLPRILRHLDEPLADASVIPNYLVAQLARQDVKVALTGIGGDELFGGYRRYYGNDLARRARLIPGPVRRGVLLPALRLLPSSGETRLGNAGRLARKFLEPLDLDPERRYLAWNAHFSESMKLRLAAGGSPPDGRASTDLLIPHFDRVKHRPFADRAMYVDIKSYLPGDPLFLGDRMTMANSLEARVPFIDSKVMEFAAALPLDQKLRGRRTKVILRDALAGRVPDAIIARPKQGFGTPIDLWLRRELKPLADVLLSPKLLAERGYFDPDYVQWLRAEQEAGRQDFSQHLWALVVLELWHRMYIDTDLSTRTELTFSDLGLPEVAEPPRSATAPAEPRSSRLRVLMSADVDPVHVIGGAERVLNNHALRLAQRGHAVTVLTRREDPSLPAEETYRGVRVVRHPVHGTGAAGFVQSVLREGGLAFARLMAEGGFDLVNVHQPLAGASVVGRAESQRVPILYTYHSPWSDEYRTRATRRSRARGVVRLASHLWIHVNSQLRRHMERRVVTRADRLLVLSDFAASQIRDLHGVPDDRIARIPGGVDCDRFHPLADRTQRRRELGLPEGPLLFTVRNLVPRMGIDQLVTAMRQVVDARPDATLLIGGDGPLRSRLQEEVRELHLQEHVRFTGFIDEATLPDHYACADIFVLPTRSLEGFGLVTVEAMACGTPVLGTPVGGTMEILNGYDARCLFAGIESADMADRILERLPEIEGNEAERARCRQHVLDRYHWEVLVSRLEALMHELALAGRTGRVG